MKHLTFLVFVILFSTTCHAAGECRDPDGNVVDQVQCGNDGNMATSSGAYLPDEAIARVNELNTKMRYFKAIGFHKQSEEKRDEIAAIYQEYNVPLPDEYKE